MKNILHVKPFDFLFLAISVLAIYSSFVFIGKKKSGTPYLIISSPTGQSIYDLNKDAKYKIKGPLGESIITVKNGEAYFEDSPCPNKTCVQSPHIHNNYDWSGCLPNQVFIRIEREDSKIQTDANAF